MGKIVSLQRAKQQCIECFCQQSKEEEKNEQQGQAYEEKNQQRRQANLNPDKDFSQNISTRNLKQGQQEILQYEMTQKINFTTFDSNQSPEQQSGKNFRRKKEEQKNKKKTRQLNIKISQNQEIEEDQEFEEDQVIKENSSQVISELINSSTNQNISPSKLNISPSLFISRKKSMIYTDYQFIGQIGQGTYGSVILAQNKKDNQLRAVKIIKKKDFGNDFFKEFKVLKRIDHPNILKLFEVYEDAETINYVTEYIEGCDLVDLIDEINQLNEDQAKVVMKQLLQSVSYCHTNGIWHMDLKLDNIICYDKSNLSIKLIDFGEAILKRKKQQVEGLVGTLKYMAPEIFIGKYSEKCDI